MRRKLIAVTLCLFSVGLTGLAADAAQAEAMASQHGAQLRSASAAGASGQAGSAAPRATPPTAMPHGSGQLHSSGFSGSAFSNGWADNDFFSPRLVKQQGRGVRRGAGGGFNHSYCQASRRVSRCPAGTARPWKN